MQIRPVTPRSDVPAEPPAPVIGFANPWDVWLCRDVIERRKACLVIAWQFRRTHTSLDRSEHLPYIQAEFAAWVSNVDRHIRLIRPYRYIWDKPVIWQRPAPDTAQSWPLVWWVMLIVGALVNAIRAGSEFRCWREA